MKIIKEGIFKLDRNKINEINSSVIKDLKTSSKNNPRNRSRILYHASENSNPQNMFICFEKNSIVEVSLHTFAESFLITSGIAQYRFYSKDGNEVIHDVRMSPANLCGTFYTFIYPETPHRFFPITDYVTALEVGHSKFSSENTSFGNKNEYKNANLLTMKEIAEQPLMKKIKTFIKKIEKDKFKFGSLNGVAELSFNKIMNICEDQKTSFVLIPEKLINNEINVKLDEIVEFFIIVQDSDTFKFKSSNSILSCIFGETEIISSEYKNKLSPNSTISLGPLKNKEYTITNSSSRISILHVANELNK